MIIYPLIVALVIALDQFTKYIVRTNMNLGDSIPILGNWFRILYVQNTGTAFSMFAGNKWITVALTAVLILLCLGFVIHEARHGSKVLAILITFVFAGGVSNMIDRLTLGYVTDMISCWSFAVFNVADIGVTCGCILAAIYLLITWNREDGSKADELREDSGK